MHIVSPTTTRSASAAVLARFQGHNPAMVVGFAVNTLRKNFGFMRRSDACRLHHALDYRTQNPTQWASVPTAHGACSTGSLTPAALIGAYVGIIAQNTALLSEKQTRTVQRALDCWVDLQRHF